jgi:diguanylate cyclase (GGDEF)-like protein
MDHPGEARIRVVIADDTADVRALLRYTLDLDGRFEVVAEAADGIQALRAAEQEQPDALILDLAMPVMDGMAAAPRIKAVAPDCHVIVLSSFGARQMAEQALAQGASAYVEKATFQTITSVLADVCRRRPGRVEAVPSPEAQASAPAAATPIDAPDHARTAHHRRKGDNAAARNASVLRQARWFASAFALLQFWLYQPPPGSTAPFPKLLTGVVLAAALAAVNLVSTRWPSPWLELGVDSAVVLTVIGLFSFDATSVLWTLLLVLVIEGALRAQLAGAVTMWAVTGAIYTVRELWATAHYQRPFALESLTYQLGVVLLVAVATGHLARNFADTSEEHMAAGEESARRAELLRLVAGASRKLAALDSEELLTAVVDAAVTLGFEGVELCTLDSLDPADAWHVGHQRGMAGEEGGPPLAALLVDTARSDEDTVVLTHGDLEASPADPWFALGYRTVVAAPIRAGENVIAALVVGTRATRPVTPSEVECLELLAAQAGVGLANVRLLDRIRHQALHDALTGLPNQLLFEDRVAQALSQAGRSGTGAALMFIDLDHFKKVNDTLGHDFGNELLRQVAGRLLGVIRSGDTVARMGGDEFTLLLPTLAQGADAGYVAGKVLSSLRAPFVVGEHRLFVTASVGIAVYPVDGLRYETLLRYADIAMYRAKAAGGNIYELYGHRSAEEVAYPRLALEADLHHAVSEGELRVVYQPQIDLTDGRVRGVEALVRWHHPELGEIGPTEFLPLAEEAGLIGIIDTWVMQTACMRAAVWRQYGADGVRVAVNVSGRQLQHPRFADVVLTALAQSGLPADLLEIEVTEGVAVTEVLEIREALDRLRRRGVRVAIDDFGTGYSMLSRLRDFPLDTLKIDRSFISEIQSEGDEAPIVSATIAMARSLGLEVVAEGVEVDAQLEFLRTAGCDIGQGFLLSRPVEADAVIDLLAPTPLANR